MRIYIKLIIVLLIFTVNEVISQNRWLNIYHDDTDAPGEYIIESYDHGYLLLGRHEANYPKYNWLIKTDLNGDILWEKTFGEGTSPLVLREMAQNSSGEIYLVGSTYYYNEYRDPIIIKLDSCGEKQWCKVFSYPDNMWDIADCIVITPDAGAAVTINFIGPTGWTDRICLTRFMPDGELLWTKCYNSTDTSLRNEDDYNLITTPDNGFLITGFCYYEDPTHPNLYWPEPYYIKVDSTGEFQWEKVIHKDDPLIGGVAWSTIVSPDSLYYYSSISHYYYDNNTSTPALVKMDMQGEVVDIYDLAPANYYGKLFQSVFISDSTLAGSAIWGSETEATPQAVIFDTLGNILDSAFLLDNDYLSYVRKTYDNKLLYFTEMLDENDNFDAYLFKLNQQLESDTTYTQWFNYDSLCPHQVVSDTIVQDNCGLIVGDVEIKNEPQKEDIIIYPNPAKNNFSVRCQLFENNKCKIEVFDIFGGKIVETITTPGENTAQMDIARWKTGLYMVRISKDGKVVGSGKVVVE